MESVENYSSIPTASITGMVRGSGKFKVKRGGGRQFSDVRNLEKEAAANKWSRRGKGESEEESEEESGQEDEEAASDEEDKENGGTEEPAAGTSEPIVPSTPEHTDAARSAKKEGKKKAKAAAGVNDEDADLQVNANRLPIQDMAISDINTPREPSRKEREAKEKQEAKERYWKLHQQGKTDQAKTDLARLAQIRKQREEAAATRKATNDAKAPDTEGRRME